MEAEVRVDVRCRDLAGCNRTDHGCRAGNGVAARKYMRRVGHEGVRRSLDFAALKRHDLRKRTGVDCLTDRHDNNVARGTQQRRICVIGTRTAVRAVRADDLRARPERGHMTVLVRLDMVRRLELKNLAAPFLLRPSKRCRRR